MTTGSQRDDSTKETVEKAVAHAERFLGENRQMLEKAFPERNISAAMLMHNSRFSAPDEDHGPVSLMTDSEFVARSALERRLANDIDMSISRVVPQNQISWLFEETLWWNPRLGDSYKPGQSRVEAPEYGSVIAMLLDDLGYTDFATVHELTDNSTSVKFWALRPATDSTGISLWRASPTIWFRCSGRGWT